jgi:formylglycine-generating enzyme required for sulfatase activity
METRSSRRQTLPTWLRVLTAAFAPSLVLGQSGAPLQPWLPKSLRVEPQPACQFDAARGPEMVVIEGGSFLMGSPKDEEEREDDEGPQHRVTVQSFAMGRCEVTMAQFEQFVNETGYRTDAEKRGGCFTLDSTGNNLEQRADGHWRKPGFTQRGTHPVVCVSFRDAEAYIAWLNLRSGRTFRLPTEAEWEYAARAGKTERFSFGDDLDAKVQCTYANGADQSIQTQHFAEERKVAKCNDKHVFTSPVGALESNGFGLYGMHGNALEWVQDCYHISYSGAPRDGTAWLASVNGDCPRHVLRGGSWFHIPPYLRSSYRYGFTTHEADYTTGFRLAMAL